jgi:hypothetical protein
MIGSEQHFRETLGSERAGVMVECVKSGTALARKVTTAQGFIQGRTEPTVAFDLVTGLLDGSFSDQSGVRRATSANQILWVIDEMYAMRNKKITVGYRTANHSSAQQGKIDHQRTLDGFPSLVYVSFGARYSSLTGLVDEYVVVKHVMVNRRRVVEWVVDLEELAGGEMVPSIPTLPMPAAPAAAEVRSKRSSENKVSDSGK